MNKNKGFTLIELMIVLALVSILSSTAIHYFSSEDYILRRTARDLYSNLQKLKIEAIKRNETGVIKFDPNNEKYTIWLDDGPAGNNWALDATDTEIKTYNMPSNIDLITTTIPFHTYGYSSKGMTDSDITPGVYEVRLRTKEADPSYMGVRVTYAGSIAVIRSIDGGVTWN